MCCTQLTGNTGRKNNAKNRHLHTIAQLCRAVSSQLRHLSTIGKKLLNSNISSTGPHNMANFGPLAPQIGREFGAPQQISTGFASWLPYCSDVAHRRPTKLCTIFGRLLGWYAVYTFLAALAPWRNFARCKIHCAPKSCILLYWQRYCTALEQWASAKLSVDQRAPPIFGRAAITLGIGPHSSFLSNAYHVVWAVAHICYLTCTYQATRHVFVFIHLDTSVITSWLCDGDSF